MIDALFALFAAIIDLLQKNVPVEINSRNLSDGRKVILDTWLKSL
jgi:hypothetical protein